MCRIKEFVRIFKKNNEPTQEEVVNFLNGNYIMKSTPLTPEEKEKVLKLGNAVIRELEKRNVMIKNKNI